MANKEIRDKNYNLIGTISDSSASPSSDFEAWEKWLFWVAALIGAFIGFSKAGIGGAIGGLIALFLIGGILAELLPFLFLGGVLWLISKLWGVGL